jgi:hypothetical protein
MTKKIIGLYQLITGVFGVFLILLSLFKDVNKDLLTQIFAGVILYGLLAWAGYGLLNKGKEALKYSKILQALQIVSFTISGTLYKFTAAGFIALGIKNGAFTWGIAGQPIDFALTTVPGNNFSIIIYVLPIILLYGLTKVK